MSLRLSIKILRRPLVHWPLLCIFYFSIFSHFNFEEGIFFSLLFTIGQSAIVHVNTKYLLPKYQEEPVKYQVSSFITLASFIAISILITYVAITFFLEAPPDKHEDEGSPIFWFIFMNAMVYGMPLFMSTSFYVLEKERDNIKHIKELEQLQGETELKFLKSQINPHFLFNALNNIYTISYIGDKSAPQKILMLSDMLRYVLYDCKSDKVPLGREIEHIQNFIAFQQMKTESPQDIGVDIRDFDEGAQLAPMVLIPFVENSFKHSKIDVDKAAYVRIVFSGSGSRLNFEIRNSLPEVAPQKWLNADGGIGLSNVRKRLELVYPDKHKLLVRTSKTEYSVNLSIELD